MVKIKKTQKVLSMIMAFSMLGSMFAVPNASAFNAIAAKTAQVTDTYFVEGTKDADGKITGYNKQTGAGAAQNVAGVANTFVLNNIANVVYSSATVADIDVHGGANLNVGEEYNIAISQSKAQADGYKISGAQIAVALEDETNNVNIHDRYIEKIELKETAGNAGAKSYTGTFKVSGAANKVLANAATELEVYIVGERQNAVTNITAKRNTHAGGGAGYNQQVNTIPFYLSDDGMKVIKADAASGLAIQEGKDLYFEVVPDAGFMIDRQLPMQDLTAGNAANGQVLLYATAAGAGAGAANLNTVAPVLPSVDDLMNVNVNLSEYIYKVPAANVTTIMNAIGNGGNIELRATTMAVGANAASVHLNNSYSGADHFGDGVGAGAAAPNADTQIPSAGVEIINAATANANAAPGTSGLGLIANAGQKVELKINKNHANFQNKKVTGAVLTYNSAGAAGGNGQAVNNLVAAVQGDEPILGTAAPGVGANVGAQAEYYPTTVRDKGDGYYYVSFIVPKHQAVAGHRGLAAAVQANNIFRVDLITTEAAPQDVTLTLANAANAAAGTSKVNFADANAANGINGVLTAKQGSTTQVEFVPANGFAFSANNFSRYMEQIRLFNAGAAAGGAGAAQGTGWSFEFVKVNEKGNLVCNVTVAADATNTNLTGTADNAAAAVPPVCTAFYFPSNKTQAIPVVKYDRIVSTNINNDDMRLSGLGSAGVVTLNGTPAVQIEFDTTTTALDAVEFAGKSYTGSDLKDIDDGSFVDKIKVTSKDNLVLKIGAKYLKGSVFIKEAEGGKVVAYTDGSLGTVLKNRVQKDTEVYVQATANEGFKFDKINAYYEDPDNGQLRVKLEEVDAKKGVYKFKMPNALVSGNYGASVTVEATFEGDSTVAKLNNSIPEDKKADNNGYAKVSGTTAKVGEEFTVEFIPNDKFMVDGTSVSYKDAEGATKTLAATKTEGNKYTYKVPEGVSADGIAISATFKPEGTISITANAGENGKITDLATYAEAGKDVTFKVTADKDFEVERVSVAYTVKDKEEKQAIAYTVKDGVYTFKVPADLKVDANTIVVSATFKKAGSISIESKSDANGKITGLASYAEAGKEVSFKVAANEGYELDKVSVAYTVKDKDNQAITYTEKDGVYTFKVPADLKADANTIVVSATFKKAGEKPADPEKPANKPEKPEDTSKPIWHETDKGWTYWDDGKQHTGWIKDETGMYPANTWFYIDVETGILKTGWFQDGGSTWYYCFTKEDAARGNVEGAMAANQWVLNNGKWYYLNAQGAMETNKWVKDSDDARWAWVGADGAWLYDE